MFFFHSVFLSLYLFHLNLTNNHRRISSLRFLFWRKNGIHRTCLCDDDGASTWVNFGLYGFISVSLSANHNWKETNREREGGSGWNYHRVFGFLFTEGRQRFDQCLVHILFQVILSWLSNWNWFHDTYAQRGKRVMIYDLFSTATYNLERRIEFLFRHWRHYRCRARHFAVHWCHTSLEYLTND